MATMAFKNAESAAKLAAIRNHLFDPQSLEDFTASFKLLSEVIRAESDADPDTRLTAEETLQVKSGYVIHAIKSVRARTGLGLKEAKDLVEAAGDKLNLRMPDQTYPNQRVWAIPFKS